MKTIYQSEFKKISTREDYVILLTRFSLVDKDNKESDIKSDKILSITTKNSSGKNILDLYLDVSEFSGYEYGVVENSTLQEPNRDTLVDKKEVRGIRVYYKIEGEKEDSEKLMLEIQDNIYDSKHATFTLDSKNNLFHIPLWFEDDDKKLVNIAVKIKSINESSEINYLESAGTDKIMNIFYLDSIGDRDSDNSISKESYKKYSISNELIPSENFGWIDNTGRFNSENYIYRVYDESTFKAGVSDMMTLGGILTKLQLFRTWSDSFTYKSVKVRGVVRYTEYQVINGETIKLDEGIADVTGIDGLEIVCDESSKGSEEFKYELDNSLSNISYKKMSNPEDLNIMPYGIFHLELSYKNLSGEIVNIKSNKFKLVQSGDTSIFNVHHSTTFSENDIKLYLLEDIAKSSKTFYATLLTDSSITTLNNNIYFLFEGDNLINGTIVPGKYRKYMESIFDIKYKVSRLLDDEGEPVKDTLRIDITLTTKTVNENNYWLPRIDDLSKLVKTTLVILANSDQYEENFYIVQKAKTLELEIHDETEAFGSLSEITVDAGTPKDIDIRKELALSIGYNYSRNLDLSNIYWRLIEVKIPNLIENSEGKYVHISNENGDPDYTTFTNNDVYENGLLTIVNDNGVENKINESIPDKNKDKSWVDFSKFELVISKNEVIDAREVGILTFASFLKDSYPLGTELVDIDSWRFYAGTSTVSIKVNQRAQKPYVRFFSDAERKNEITTYKVREINSYPLYIESNLKKVTVAWKGNYEHIASVWGKDSEAYSSEGYTSANWTDEQRKLISDNLIRFYGDITNEISENKPEYTININSENYLIYFNVNYNIEHESSFNIGKNVYEYKTFTNVGAGSLVFYDNNNNLIDNSLPIEFEDFDDDDLPSSYYGKNVRVKGIHNNPYFIDFEEVDLLKDKFTGVNFIYPFSTGELRATASRHLSLRVNKSDMYNMSVNFEYTVLSTGLNVSNYHFVIPKFGLIGKKPSYIYHQIFVRLEEKNSYEFPLVASWFATRLIFVSNNYRENGNSDIMRCIFPVFDKDDCMKSEYSTAIFPNTSTNYYESWKAVATEYKEYYSKCKFQYEFGLNKTYEFEYEKNYNVGSGNKWTRYPSLVFNFAYVGTLGSNRLDQWVPGMIRFGKDYVNNSQSIIYMYHNNRNNAHEYTPGFHNGIYDGSYRNYNAFLTSGIGGNDHDFDDEPDFLLFKKDTWFRWDDGTGYTPVKFTLITNPSGTVNHKYNYLRLLIDKDNYYRLVQDYCYYVNINYAKSIGFGRAASFEFFGDHLKKGLANQGQIHFYQTRSLFRGMYKTGYEDKNIYYRGIFDEKNSFPGKSSKNNGGCEFKTWATHNLSADQASALLNYIYEQYHCVHLILKVKTATKYELTDSNDEDKSVISIPIDNRDSWNSSGSLESFALKPTNSKTSTFQSFYVHLIVSDRITGNKKPSNTYEISTVENHKVEVIKFNYNNKEDLFNESNANNSIELTHWTYYSGTGLRIDLNKKSFLPRVPYNSNKDNTKLGFDPIELYLGHTNYELDNSDGDYIFKKPIKIMQKGSLYAIRYKGSSNKDQFFVGDLSSEGDDKYIIEENVSSDATEFKCEISKYFNVGEKPEYKLNIDPLFIVTPETEIIQTCYPEEEYGPDWRDSSLFKNLNENLIEYYENLAGSVTFKFPKNDLDKKKSYDYKLYFSINKSEELNYPEYQVFDTSVILRITQGQFNNELDILDYEEGSVVNFYVDGSSVEYFDNILYIESNNSNLVEDLEIKDSNGVDGLVKNWEIWEDKDNWDEVDNKFRYKIVMNNNSRFNKQSGITGNISFIIDGEDMGRVRYKQGYLCLKLIDANNPSSIHSDDETFNTKLPYYLTYELQEFNSDNDNWETFNNHQENMFDSKIIRDGVFEVDNIENSWEVISNEPLYDSGDKQIGYLINKYSLSEDTKSLIESYSTEVYEEYNGKTYNPEVLIDTASKKSSADADASLGYSVKTTLKFNKDTIRYYITNYPYDAISALNDHVTLEFNKNYVNIK